MSTCLLQGISADSGHYVANVCDSKDRLDGAHYDSSMSLNASGIEASSASITLDQKKMASKSTKTVEEKWWRCNDCTVYEINAKILKVETGSSPESTKHKKRKRDDFGKSATTNAYMLVYRLRREKGSKKKKGKVH